MKQQTFAGMIYQTKKKQIHLKEFLAEMEQVVLWSELYAAMEPNDPKAGRRGRPPMPATLRLRIDCMQQW